VNVGVEAVREPMSTRVRYYDPHRPALPPFRSGEAGVVWLSKEEVFETDTRVVLSPNTLHSLIAHGVVEKLAALPAQMGPLGPGREAVLSPGALPEALHIFYEADRQTYGVRHDLLVASGWGMPPTDYRIAVDNREYQRSLSQLQFLASQASRMGHGLRLRL
jgi:hypothetical protein